MTKKIASVILLGHIILMTIVVLFNSRFGLQGKGAIPLIILAAFFFAILMGVNDRRFYWAGITGALLYSLLNTFVLSLFLLWPPQSSRPHQDIVFLSLFLPGIIGAFLLFVTLIKQRKAVAAGSAEVNASAEEPERPPAKWGLLATLAWGIVIAVVFVVVQLLVAVVYVGVNYGKLPSEETGSAMEALFLNGTVLSLCTFSTLIICGGMILGIIKLKKGAAIKNYIGWHLADRRTGLRWLSILCAYMILSEILSTVLDKSAAAKFMFFAFSSTSHPLFLVMALIVAGPLFEELFFRGFLFSGLQSSAAGSLGAIIITAALWAATHLQYGMYEISTIFVLGLILGAARQKSGSVVLTIALHSFNNIVSTIEIIVKVSGHSA